MVGKLTIKTRSIQEVATIGCEINETLDRFWRISEYPKPR